MKTLLSKPKTPREICVAEDLKNNKLKQLLKIVKKILKT